MISAAKKRSVVGWALYDFANSAFTTSILTVIFSVYFVKQIIPADGWVLLGASWSGATVWSFLNSAVMAVVLVTSPFLGARADRNRSKSRYLRMFCSLGCVATAALFWAWPGRTGFGVQVAFLAIFCYEMSLVFYNAFLPDLSTDLDAGFVSGYGFALGYIGGGLCLALNMVMVMKPALFGLATADASLPVRTSFAVVAVWWFVFSVPLFLWVKDKPFPAGWTAPAMSVASQLKTTIGHVRKNPNLGRFLLSYLLYNDGIQTLLLMAAIVGAQEIGLGTAQLAMCYLLIQFVAFIGAIFCGRWADQYGHKRIIFVTLVVYSLVTIWGVVMKSPWEFWGLGIVVGLVLGGSQAASRSLFSILIPSKEQSGEFFALFSIVGKAAALMGPLIFGIVNQGWGLRAAVGSLLIFFVAGAVLLVGVRESLSTARSGS